MATAINVASRWLLVSACIVGLVLSIIVLSLRGRKAGWEQQKTYISAAHPLVHDTLMLVNSLFVPLNASSMDIGKETCLMMIENAIHRGQLNQRALERLDVPNGLEGLAKANELVILDCVKRCTWLQAKVQKEPEKPDKRGMAIYMGFIFSASGYDDLTEVMNQWHAALITSGVNPLDYENLVGAPDVFLGATAHDPAMGR